MSDRPILVVEDSDSDFEAVRRAFAQVDPTQLLVRERSAEAALAHLENEGLDPHDIPAFALIDLNLPGRSGLAFITAVRRCQRLQAFPVIVLTSSINPRDVTASYVAGANGFVTKPFELADLVTAIDLLHRYWRDVVRVPPPATFSGREITT